MTAKSCVPDGDALEKEEAKEMSPAAEKATDKGRLDEIAEASPPPSRE